VGGAQSVPLTAVFDNFQALEFKPSPHLKTDPELSLIFLPLQRHDCKVHANPLFLPSPWVNNREKGAGKPF
jgi:hypothetical protein